jgi:tetratricopeptide (TPR) repeat protein
MRPLRSRTPWYRIALGPTAFVRGSIAASLIGVMALGAAPAAQAQRRRAADPPADDAAARVHARAIALFEQSVEAYRAGRFADAATMLREAYGLEPAPVLLYNLARALDADGQLVEARDAYARYLAAEPNADQSATCARRIEVLDAQIAAAARAAQPAVVATPEPVVVPEPIVTPEDRGADATPAWVVLGVGAAGVVAGAVLVGVAVSRHDAAVNEPVSSTAAQIDAEAYLLRDVGIATLVVGGVAAAVGVTWGIVASGSSGGAEASVSIGPGGVSARGTF